MITCLDGYRTNCFVDHSLATTRGAGAALYCPLMILKLTIKNHTGSRDALKPVAATGGSVVIINSLYGVNGKNTEPTQKGLTQHHFFSPIVTNKTLYISQLNYGHGVRSFSLTT